MLSIFIGILIAVMVIVSVLLVLIILMQRPKQEGLGAAFGGGMMDSVAGAHTTDVLQKATIWLASVFIGGAIVIAILQAQKLRAEDVGEVLPEPAAEPALPSSIPSISDLPPLPETTLPGGEMPPATDEDASPPAANGESGGEGAGEGDGANKVDETAPDAPASAQESPPKNGEATPATPPASSDSPTDQ